MLLSEVDEKPVACIEFQYSTDSGPSLNSKSAVMSIEPLRAIPASVPRQASAPIQGEGAVSILRRSSRNSVLSSAESIRGSTAVVIIINASMIVRDVLVRMGFTGAKHVMLVI